MLLLLFRPAAAGGLAAAGCAQAAASGSGSVAQVHALAAAGAAQPAVSGTGAVGQAGPLLGAAAVQAAGCTAAAVQQQHTLVAAPSVQDAVAAASAVVQAHMLAAANAAQAGLASAGNISFGAPPPTGPGQRLVAGRPRLRTRRGLSRLRRMEAEPRLRTEPGLPRLRRVSGVPRLRSTDSLPEHNMPPDRLDTIDVSEVDVITFDYQRLLNPGETLQGANVSAEVFRGTDASASSMVVGSATVQPTRVLQRVQGRLAGVTYTLRCVAPTSASRTLTLAALLPCDRL